MGLVTDAGECAKCGDFQPSHLNGPCRVRNYYGPGRNDYVLCQCPGFEAGVDEEEGDTD